MSNISREEFGDLTNKISNRHHTLQKEIKELREHLLLQKRIIRILWDRINHGSERTTYTKETPSKP